VPYHERVLLASAPAGAPLTVVHARADTPALTRRLAELGVRPGAVVRISTRTSGGGAILAIGDDRIAVAGVLLRGIEVSEDSAP